ncbi:MAG TPA: transcriptional regulator NrdR, partial [Verrucomicrobiae bacterium]|nr:transcriptional regulator NrdR [Verrucomicrobiae bacterium]
SDGQSTRRRRMCEACKYRFTTYERVERPLLVVIKNNGTRELFNRAKLLAGLYRATEKTPVTNVQLERLVADIEESLYGADEEEVPTSRIGEMVMERLALLNEVAYVRFASVYRRFKDITGFERELLSIKRQRVDQKS